MVASKDERTVVTMDACWVGQKAALSDVTSVVQMDALMVECWDDAMDVTSAVLRVLA